MPATSRVSAEARSSFRTFTFVDHETAGHRHGGDGRYVRNRAAALMVPRQLGSMHCMSTWAFENSRFDGPSLQPREFHQVVGVESGRKDGPTPQIEGESLATHCSAAKLRGQNRHRIRRPDPGNKVLSDICQRQHK